MIKSIADKETDKIWNETHSRKLPADIQQRALNKLAILDAAKDLNDLRVPPSNRLEALTGDRKDFYSIRINGQWRICFRWDGGNAYDVGIQDYH